MATAYALVEERILYINQQEMLQYSLYLNAKLYEKPAEYQLSNKEIQDQEKSSKSEGILERFIKEMGLQ